MSGSLHPWNPFCLSSKIVESHEQEPPRKLGREAGARCRLTLMLVVLRQSLTEPCEEVRLALVRLLRALVALGGKSFGAYVGDAVAVLQAVCDDPFHEVQEESCAVLIELNGRRCGRVEGVKAGTFDATQMAERLAVLRSAELGTGR